MTADTVHIDRRRLRLTNLEKVLYPSTGFTKADLIDYYIRVAPLILPHLRGRPVMLKRYPNGVDQPFFFEKNCPAHRPDWMPTATVRYSASTTIEHCLIEDRATLAWLANLAAIEFHTSLAYAETIDEPTMIMFDLDPGEGATLADCADVALVLRSLLKQLDFRAVVKASGSKGLHVALPLNTPITYAEARPLAHALGRLVEKQLPDRVTTNVSKAVRTGRVFIDWSQNARHKTTVCVYSMRATTDPAVSMAMDWPQVQRLAKRGKAGTAPTAPARALQDAEKDHDKFEGAWRWRQRLDERKKLPRDLLV